MAPFFGEVRVDPRAEPGLFLAPLETLSQEHLADPAAPHADALLAEVGHQAIQGPRGEGQAQLRRTAQGGLDDRAPLLGRVGRRPPRAHVLFQPRQAALIEPLEPEPNRGAAQTHPGRDVRRAQALLQGVLHNLRPTHQPSAEAARARHARQRFGFVAAQSAHPDGHDRTPGQPTPHPTCWPPKRHRQLTGCST